MNTWRQPTVTAGEPPAVPIQLATVERASVFSSALLTSVACGADLAPNSEVLHDPSDELFTNTVLRHLRLDVAAKDMARLRAYRWQKGEASEERPTAPWTSLETLK